MRNFVFIIFCLPIGLFAINDAGDNTSLYNVALGGPHTGMIKGFDSFYNNPALLAEYEKEFSLFNLDLNLKGDTFEILNMVLANELTTEDTTALLDTLTERGLTNLLVGINFNTPVSIGLLGKNWGFNLKNTTDVFLELPSLLSDLDFLVREDIILAAGVAFPIVFNSESKHSIKFTSGLMSRITVRGEMKIESDILGLLSYAQDFTTILNDFPINLSPMFSVDAGFLVCYADMITLSGVVKDLYTPLLQYPVQDLSGVLDALKSDEYTTGSMIYREINLGLAFDSPLGILSTVISDLDIYFDYYDLLDLEKNTYMHMGLGLNIELLDQFNILVGINEGLLSLGLNIDVGIFDIGFAMYGTEEGNQPGLNSTFNFLLSTGISF